MKGLAHVNTTSQIWPHNATTNHHSFAAQQCIMHATTQSDCPLERTCNTFEFCLTKKQSIHCSSTRSWLIHKRLLWLIIAHAAYNTRMACKIPRHDHEYITFTRPSTCCHLRLIVQALTTNGKHSLLLPKTRFLAYDITPHAHGFVFVDWVQGASTCNQPSQGSRV